MKLRILIADDEKLARSRIKRLIEIYYDKKLEPHNFEIFETTNGPEALSLCNQLSPDILFLDVKMPGLSGFEVLQQLSKQPLSLVFQTAYSEFAIQAFEASACDYLLKPFSEERFFQSLDRAQNNRESILRLRNHLAENQHFLQRICIKAGSKVNLLPVHEILYFTSKDNYTLAISSRLSSATEHIVDLSLSALDERLDPQLFMKIHRNCIVRIEAIEQIRTDSGQTFCIVGESELPVSRANKTRLMTKLRN